MNVTKPIAEARTVPTIWTRELAASRTERPLGSNCAASGRAPAGGSPAGLNVPLTFALYSERWRASMDTPILWIDDGRPSHSLARPVHAPAGRPTRRQPGDRTVPRASRAPSRRRGPPRPLARRGACRRHPPLAVRGDRGGRRAAWRPVVRGARGEARADAVCARPRHA